MGKDIRGYTPGLWRVSEENPMEVRTGNRLCKGGPVALVNGFGVNEKCARANAQLIAVAPEMLEVLREFIRGVEAVYGSDWGGEEWFDLRITYRRALALVGR